MKVRTTRALTGALAIAAVSGALAQLAGGCAQNQITVPVRSMSRSGRVSFVCLGPPTTSVFYNPGQNVERDLVECSGQQLTSTCQYQVEDDAGDVDAGAPPIPHMYALVTQTTTGEVAVVDTNSVSGSVLDENPREPGANFLHVGALPTGIVSTPGSVATFVGVAELGREGFFALPSSPITWNPPGAGAADPDLGTVSSGTPPDGGTGTPGIRPLSDTGIPDNCYGGTGGNQPEFPLYDQTVPGLTQRPSCYLGYAPGDMLLIADPPNPDDGTVRASCDDAYMPPSDLISAQEQRGRQKLVVTVPELGGIAVIDADWLLARKPGTFDECKVERWLPLSFTASDHAGLAAQPALPTGPACSNPVRGDIPLQSTYAPRPSGLTYADGTLYVADIGAPIIHVVDMHDVDAQGNRFATPCNPVERAPLLPTSAEDPTRVVFASKVSVASTLTPDFKRYLYATDVQDSSAMVFDVSADSTTRRPLLRKHPEWNPFEPRDRVKFAAPPADILIVQRDTPQVDPVTGVARSGVLCNPDPGALTCPPSTGNTCDVGTKYRTSSDYTLGAGPGTLRGEFAFAALTSGRLAVIDVSDFDAPCRTPVRPSVLAGCAADAPGPDVPPGDTPQQMAAAWVGSELLSAGDISCNTIDPLSPRAGSFEAVGVTAGNHVPGIQTFPILYNADGSVFDTTKGTPPQMVATLPASIPAACTSQPCDPHACGSACDPLPGCPLELSVGGVQTPLNFPGNTCNTASGVTPGVTGTIGSSDQQSNALLMNIEDPRAQLVDQNWTVTFEGAIPGFEQRVADLWSQNDPASCAPNAGTDVLCDANSQFCNAGVLSQKAMSEMLAAQGAAAPQNVSAAGLADYVQITNELPDPTDQYWTSGMAFAGQPVCFPPNNGCAANGGTCSAYSQCLSVFGTTDVPVLSPCRDLTVVEAYQDHLELEPRNQANPQCAAATAEAIKCCFPTALTFTVRGGDQWMVVGDQSGFLHHVVADASTGKCRNSCDPMLARKNGRLIETPMLPSSGVADRATNPLDPGNVGPSGSFINPMFRFAILSAVANGQATCGTSGAVGSPDGMPCQPANKGTDCCSGFCNPNNLQCGPTGLRDAAFHFSTFGSFAPQLISLAADATSLVTPQAVTYLPPTQEVVVTDGSINGIIFVTLQGSSVSRSYF